MSTVLDYLKAPEFADDRLTEAINVPPNVTGRLAQLGLFTDSPIVTTYAKIGLLEDQITIIPARERGGPANKNMRGGRSQGIVQIPHFPLDDAITPSDLQNVLVYGANYVFQTIGTVYNDKLQSIRSKHDATHANLDWGAINGLIIDAENKELLNVYSEFGITQPTMSFALSTDTTDVASKNRALKTMIRGALKGVPATGVRVFAGGNFFDKYVSHPTVRNPANRETLQYYTSLTPADEITDSFTFAGLTLERVEETFDVRLDNGTFETRPAIAPNEAIAVPLGTPYFRRFIAPPDTIQDANVAPQIGAKVFVSTADLAHGKGREIHTESNVLPICLRPQTMVKLTMG